ncbi:nucleic acid/nucleotide deaminase domain-containing protein [Paractinoplanes rhizophilus]|uniref:Nucleic acid/nucleotide deaminase domain-containing protein n=1 Tax=Paractinoplanes rhizophilus TaxID=1416877 RepID=A0ABW2I3P0_9ACTN
MERTTRTAVWGRLAAVLLLLWALVGGLPADPALAGRAVAALSAVDPGCPPVTADGQVVYGCNELSRNLQKARLWLQQNKPRGTTDKLFKNASGSNYAIAKLRDGTYIIGYSDSVAHSEERLIDQMNGKSQRIVFDPATGRVSYQAPRASPIVEGFSELEPCANKCDPKLRALGLREKFTYSWQWNGRPGDSADEIKAIRDRANNAKTGYKPLALKQLKANGAPGRINIPENIESGVGRSAQRITGPGRPGGIDFSAVQLRYVSDGATGNTYSFKAPTTPGKPSTDGAGAIYDAYTAMNVWMTVQPSKFWVNLNPDEPDRIIDADLAQTDAGRVLLESDLTLKESGTKLLDPNQPIGKEFWARMQAAGLEKFCKRDWIVPKQATVRESGSELYILDAPLEVKSEGADFQMPGSDFTCPGDSKQASEIYRAVIVPELTRLVNESPEYVDLRRVYISRVAAEWYRQRMAKNGTAEDFGIDSNNVDTLEAIKPWDPKDVYNKYLKELNSVTYTTPDGFVVTAGGVDFTQPVKVKPLNDNDFTQQYPALPSTVQKSLTEVARTTDEKDAFNGGADRVPAITKPPSASPSPGGTAGGSHGNNGGQGGGLPITGAPVFAIAVIGVALILFGLVAVWRTRRVRWVAKR